MHFSVILELEAKLEVMKIMTSLMWISDRNETIILDIKINISL